jgi:hypothetical protein
VLAQHAPHAHGVAELRVAVDGKRLHIELESPLDNLVGFEHEPKTARERAALAAAEETLRGGDALFVLPAEAGCVLAAVELESPYPQTAGDDPGRARDEEKGHSDMDVTYEYNCANPAALNAMRVNLSEAFPRMQRILAETATPAGQGKATLDQSRRTLPL